MELGQQTSLHCFQHKKTLQKQTGNFNKRQIRKKCVTTGYVYLWVQPQTLHTNSNIKRSALMLVQLLISYHLIKAALCCLFSKYFSAVVSQSLMYQRVCSFHTEGWRRDKMRKVHVHVSAPLSLMHRNEHASECTWDSSHDMPLLKYAKKMQICLACEILGTNWCLDAKKKN